MNDQGSADQPAGQEISQAELLKRIQASRAALENTLSSLSEEQLTKPGPYGWSVKDHLAHLAAWELGIAELLRRRPRFAAMQVEEAVAQGRSEEEVNDLIYRRHAGLPLPEVIELFQEAHRRLLQAVEEMDDEDLLKPYASFAASFVPGGGELRQNPVLYWIVGNTYEHFDEHHGYIQAILK